MYAHAHTHTHTHIYTPCQLSHKPQLYKDFLLPEDTSSSEESEGSEENNDVEDPS